MCNNDEANKYITHEKKFHLFWRRRRKKAKPRDRDLFLK